MRIFVDFNHDVPGVQTPDKHVFQSAMRIFVDFNHSAGNSPHYRRDVSIRNADFR